MTSVADVFVSYSHKDVRRVSEVVSALEEAKIKVWQDNIRVDHGDRIREMVNAGVRDSTVVLIFISNYSLRSRYVLNELDMAMERERRERKTIVIPILLGSVRTDTSDYPEDLKGKKHFDLRFGFDKQFRHLRSIIVARVKLALPPNHLERFSKKIRMGEAFIQFLANYKFCGRNENFPVPARIVEITAETMRDTWRYWETAPGIRQDHEEFAREYGTFILRQLAIFAFDYSGYISLTKGWTDEDWVNTAIFINCCIEYFMVNRELKVTDGRDVVMGIPTREGKVGWWSEPKKEDREENDVVVINEVTEDGEIVRTRIEQKRRRK
jgi:hypothetical protein